MAVSYDPAQGFPGVVPILLYRDVDAAVGWLVSAFGFSVLRRARGADGRSGHVDVAAGRGVVMVEPAPPGFVPPAPAGKERDFVLVMVDDVDAHYRRCCRAGASLASEPTDRPWGLRQYLAHDLEGHAWEFSQFLRDVPVDQWHPPGHKKADRSTVAPPQLRA